MFASNVCITGISFNSLLVIVCFHSFLASCNCCIVSFIEFKSGV
ncbi:MAG: hypothetical protein WCG25_04845 [bacterium]